MTMTLIDVLHHHSKSRPNSVAFRIGADVWTRERLTADVERLARGLAKRGLREGNRVALHMANLAELVVAYYACFRIGAIAAPLNTRLKTAELRPLLERLQPAFYIGQADLYRRIAAIDASIIPSNARFIVGDAVDDRWAQPLTKLLEEGQVGPVRTLPGVHAPAVLLTTSGQQASLNSSLTPRQRWPPVLIPRGIWGSMMTTSQPSPCPWSTGSGYLPSWPVSSAVRRSSCWSALIPMPC